ncbi:hypothetical protein MG295_00003 [Bacillus phage vB_BcgM]|nr:hypothetical protein MG295_00003 [Bacillus phage vB_BcgM]
MESKIKEMIKSLEDRELVPARVMIDFMEELLDDIDDENLNYRADMERYHYYND